MSVALNWRRLTFAACAVFAFAVAVPNPIAGVSVAHAQMSAEFQAALQPYGSWRRHARWGLVWQPAHRPRGWRPYTYGHWVYTDDWGWYWISDRAEEDFGWVTYHYGRWLLDRRMGWVWVRGDQWAPAWVNWRRGGDYLGWAPLPPDAVIGDYDNSPAYWNFVQPRYLVDTRVRRRLLPPTRTRALLRATVVVNRTLVTERSHVAINAGIAPALVAAAARASIQSYRVAPRVTAGTQGVTGAVTVRPQDLSRRGRRGARSFAVSVQKTSVVKPAASVPKPKPLGKGERGRVGAFASQPQQQPQTPATPPARTVKRSATEPPIKPQMKPQLKPHAAPIVAPSAIHPGERQTKPHRRIAPQTPPPPMLRSRGQSPSDGLRSPPRPVAPVAKPVAQPSPPAAKPPSVSKPASVTKPSLVAKPVAVKKTVIRKQPAVRKKVRQRVRGKKTDANN